MFKYIEPNKTEITVQNGMRKITGLVKKVIEKVVAKGVKEPNVKKILKNSSQLINEKIPLNKISKPDIEVRKLLEMSSEMLA